jgi:hypothetical protein
MKTLPCYPYLQKIVNHYYTLNPRNTAGDDGYREYLESFGFVVPIDIMKNQLEFPDSFGDRDMMLFQLRWS